MWIAKFKLKDDQDIYSSLCEKFKVEFYAFPHTNYIKDRKINLILSGTISGKEENKKEFLESLKIDKRIKSLESYKDYLLIHAIHPISRESKAEIRIFYNPEYIIIKPIHISSDGWEYWEVGCVLRESLNKLINSALKHYHGELFSINNEKIKTISTVNIAPDVTDKQLEAIKLAYKNGYYNYPRNLTLPVLASSIKKSYSTFQENLRKAENKIISHFLNYR
ncbi:MAG: helix-turn-helix domain-containing protein [Nanoarchaeota archaeon]